VGLITESELGRLCTGVVDDDDASEWDTTSKTNLGYGLEPARLTGDRAIRGTRVVARQTCGGLQNPVKDNLSRTAATNGAQNLPQRVFCRRSFWQCCRRSHVFQRRGGVMDEKHEDGGLGQWFPVTSPPYLPWRVVSTQRGGLCPAITSGAGSKISL
jgi:hypothetical protein